MGPPESSSERATALRQMQERLTNAEARLDDAEARLAEAEAELEQVRKDIGTAPDPTSNEPDGSGMKRLIVYLCNEIREVKQIGRDMLSLQSKSAPWTKTVPIAIAIALVTFREVFVVIREIIK